MMVLIAWLVSLLVLVTFSVFMYLTGTRAGDRPEDATVQVQEGRVIEHGNPSRAALVTVSNPSNTAIVVGLSERHLGRKASAFRMPLTVTVPWWRTDRAQLLPSSQSKVGIVEPRATQQWVVPVADGNQPLRVVVVVGQTGGRLRVHDRVLTSQRQHGDEPANPR